MSEKITEQQSDDPGNPYAAPTVDMGDPWTHGPPEALELRRAHRREESYVKGLAIINFAYAVLFGIAAVQEVSILIGYLAGQANAAWIVRPARIASLVVSVCMPIAAFGAGCGFLRRKRLGATVGAGVCRVVVRTLAPRTTLPVQAQTPAGVPGTGRRKPHAGRTDAGCLVPPKIGRF